MTSGDLIAILPLIIVAGSAVVTLLAIAIHRSHRLTAGLAIAGLAGAFAATFQTFPPGWRCVAPPLLTIDRFALFYMGLVFAASAAVVLLAYGYLAARDCRREEFYVLVLLAARAVIQEKRGHQSIEKTHPPIQLFLRPGACEIPPQPSKK